MDVVVAVPPQVAVAYEAWALEVPEGTMSCLSKWLRLSGAYTCALPLLPHFTYGLMETPYDQCTENIVGHSLQMIPEVPLKPPRK